MADDPLNQQQFAKDVANDETYGNLGSVDEDFKLPNVDEVWKLIEQMDGISDEERKSLRENLYNPQDGASHDFMKRLSQPDIGRSNWDYLIFTAMIAIIVVVFALFGLKLYKSLTEKSLKKNEKLKKRKQIINLKKKN